MWSMSRLQTDAYAMLQSEATVVPAALLLLFLLCAVAVLQSRLTRAAGHWAQHRRSMIEPVRPKLMPTTSAAELYYLRHDRSCASAATGSNGGHLGPSSTLQISGISFIARFLQSLWRCCYITFLAPVARMLQSIYQKLLYHITLAMKLVILLFAMLQSTLEIAQKLVSTWPSPLELAACFHLASVPTHQVGNCICLCDQGGCWVRASTRPSIQDISTTALALCTLFLAFMDWHVPRTTQWQLLTCRILPRGWMAPNFRDKKCWRQILFWRQILVPKIVATVYHPKRLHICIRCFFFLEKLFLVAAVSVQCAR